MKKIHVSDKLLKISWFYKFWEWAILNGVFYILIKFESDRISPRESAINGRIFAHGWNFKILVNSKLLFEI